jgi:uncharacterized NAD(P)/FAD-binding protein YdhS
LSNSNASTSVRGFYVRQPDSNRRSRKPSYGRYDLVIVGSGLSCCYSLLDLFERLRWAPLIKPLSVAVLEKAGEFWTGVPFGERSSVNSLMITPLAEFIPDDERLEFEQWLSERKDSWLQHHQLLGGPAARTWIMINRPLIEVGQWDSLYLPRYLYGIFLREKIAAAIAQARRTGLSSVSTIRAEAIEVSTHGDGSYEVQLERENKDRSFVNAASILLTIGSPPYSTLAPFAADATAANIINDPYSPSLTENLGRIKDVLSRAGKHARNCILIGANATALELLHNLSHIRGLANSVDRFVLLSKSGRLPYRASPANGAPIKFSHLESAVCASQVTAEGLFEAITQDIETARKGNRNINDIVRQLGPLLSVAVAHAGDETAKTFQHRCGMRFTRLIRRAGHEYCDSLDILSARGKLEVVTGRLLRLDQANSRGTIGVDYVTSDGSARRHRLSFSMVVNCSGFEPVTAATSSPLIKNLITSGLCKPHVTKHGFEVNERLEAARNFFVVGPLLAGVFNPQMRYWHLENARRIRTVSAMAACYVLGRLEQNAVRHAT